MALAAICCTAGPAACDTHSKLVYPGPGKKLVYTPYTDQGDTIPDFSNCGYGGGGVRIPSVVVWKTLSPSRNSADPSTEVGWATRCPRFAWLAFRGQQVAHPTDSPSKGRADPSTGSGQDDTARIQAAIDEVSKRPVGKGGLRGAVLLKAGRYQIEGTLTIAASGVVLRGEGHGAKSGTVLVATGTKKRDLIAVGGTGRPREINGTRTKIVGAYVPVGARSFRIESTKGLAVGDDVIVARHGNAKWISALGADKLRRGEKDHVRNWKPFALNFQRVITAIDGRKITVDAPIVCAIQARYGGGEVYKYTWRGRIRQVGVEFLRAESTYASAADEKHAWNFIRIGAVRDGWVRNVTSRYFGYSCVNVSDDAARVTIQDSQCLDPVSKITGGRRYSFALKGQLTLVQRCFARHGRHDFVMHSRAGGPNVFLDCQAVNVHSDSGPHHRWSTGTLYDNVVCGPLNVQNRGRSGTGHGWAGAQMVFWNCTAGSIDCQKPPTAQNFAIGCKTPKRGGKGWWESPGKHVQPRSLYLRQLEDRLGKQAVKNIAKKGA